MFFPEARRGAHRWNSCWKHQELWMLVGLLSRPSGTLKFTPGALPALVYFQSNMSALFPSSFSLLPHSITIHLPHLSTVLAPFQYLSPFRRTLPCISILSTFTPIHPPLSSPSTPVYAPLPMSFYSLFTRVKRGRRQQGMLNASTMTGAGSGCLAVVQQ